VDASRHAFSDKINQFRWRDLDSLHGTLRVWEPDGVRLVLLTEDESAKTYILSDQHLKAPELATAD
jgi:hypothetical protein